MRFTSGVVAVLVCAVLASQPLPARADVALQRDALGDVARSRVGSNLYTPAPAQVQPDILGIRVVHGRRTIAVQVRLRELSPDTNGNFTTISVRTKRRTRAVQVNAFPGHWAGTSTTRDAAGHLVVCAVGHRIDYVRNRILLSMPRSCVGRPHWIRVGVRSTVAGASWVYADQSRGTGISSTLRYGRRVLR